LLPEAGVPYWSASAPVAAVQDLAQRREALGRFVNKWGMPSPSTSALCANGWPTVSADVDERRGFAATKGQRGQDAGRFSQM
jgi:hypothetical protein